MPRNGRGHSGFHMRRYTHPNIDASQSLAFSNGRLFPLNLTMIWVRLTSRDRDATDLGSTESKQTQPRRQVDLRLCHRQNDQRYDCAGNGLLGRVHVHAHMREAICVPFYACSVSFVLAPLVYVVVALPVSTLLFFCLAARSRYLCSLHEWF